MDSTLVNFSQIGKYDSAIGIYTKWNETSKVYEIFLPLLNKTIYCEQAGKLASKLNFCYYNMSEFYKLLIECSIYIK
jgi:hypothetical protein